MTAHAMSGDREKCIEAGMNDYVSKPIYRKELFAALRRNIQVQSTGTEGLGKKKLKSEYPISKSQIPRLPGVDTKEGVERLGGSWNLYADILKDFCQSQKEFVHEFRFLIEQNDFEGARAKAHALKGAAGNLSAVKLRISAKVLEEICGTRDKEQILTFLKPVQDSLSQIITSSESLFSKSQAEELSGERIESESAKDIPPEHLRELFESLDKNLRDSDPIASESCLREIRNAVLPDELKAEVDKLAHQIREYHFDEALKILAQVTGRR
jgi:HPt (histidine-containing phosphotransfer) domain-containing protein